MFALHTKSPRGINFFDCVFFVSGRISSAGTIVFVELLSSLTVYSAPNETLTSQRTGGVLGLSQLAVFNQHPHSLPANAYLERLLLPPSPRSALLYLPYRRAPPEPGRGHSSLSPRMGSTSYSGTGEQQILVPHLPIVVLALMDCMLVTICFPPGTLGAADTG